MDPAVSIEDRLAVGELLASYALLIDQGRLDEWLDVFLPDALMTVPGMDPICSHADRLEMARSSPKGTHLCAQPVIRPGDGPGELRAEQAYIFRGVEGGLFLSGWYEDRLVQRDGSWYIAERRVHFARRPRPA